MPFLDDIPIKGCPEDTKDESIGADGCRRFVTDHIADCEKILQRLEGARLTFSGEKSAFGQPEILVVRHLCGSYDWKPSLTKVEAISAMKEECGSVTKVRRFFVACAFYDIWIPHYAHVAEPSLWPAEEQVKIRLDERTYGGDSEAKENAYRGTGFAQSRKCTGNSGLHHS